MKTLPPSRLTRMKALPGHSYFGECPRDEGGHCKASGSGKRGSPNAPEGLTTVTENGVEFTTGKPVTFEFIRNTEKAPKMKNGEFGTDIEPAGRYLLHNSANVAARGNWITGKVEFKKPLVLALSLDDDIYGPNGWKARLSQAYGGKKGKALSKALAKDGYDGIVTTVGDNETREIVDLASFHNPTLPPSNLTKSLDFYYTKQAPGPAPSPAPSAKPATKLPASKVAKPAAPDQPGKQGEFKDSAGRRYCLRDGQRVPCAPGAEEVHEDVKDGTEAPDPHDPKKTQLNTPATGGAKPTMMEPVGGDTNKDFSDPQFAKEWDQIVAKEMDSIEQNNVSQHQFTPEQGKAEAGWWQKVVAWAQGGGKPGPGDVGAMARFQSGIRNPDLAQNFLDLARTVLAVASLDAKSINNLADEFEMRTLGPQTKPVSKALLSWSDRAKMAHGSGKHGTWQLPRKAMRDTGKFVVATDEKTGKQKKVAEQEHDTDKYKDHWLNQFKAKAKRAGVDLADEKIMEQALALIDESAGESHDDDKAHGNVIKELEKLIDNNSPYDHNDPALKKAAAAAAAAGAGAGAGGQPNTAGGNTPVAPPALPPSGVGGTSPQGQNAPQTPANASGTGAGQPPPLTRDEMAKVLAAGPLTHEVLMGMNPMDRRVALAAEREARPKVRTAMKKEQEPFSKEGAPDAARRAGVAAQRGRAAGKKRDKETPEQRDAREAQEKQDLAVRRQKDEARAKLQQAAMQKRNERRENAVKAHWDQMSKPEKEAIYEQMGGSGDPVQWLAHADASPLKDKVLKVDKDGKAVVANAPPKNGLPKSKIAAPKPLNHNMTALKNAAAQGAQPKP